VRRADEISRVPDLRPRSRVGAMRAGKSSPMWFTCQRKVVSTVGRVAVRPVAKQRPSQSHQANGYRSLDEGAEVEFEVKQGPKGLQAENVRLVG